MKHPRPKEVFGHRDLKGIRKAYSNYLKEKFNNNVAQRFKDLALTGKASEIASIYKRLQKIESVAGEAVKKRVFLKTIRNPTIKNVVKNPAEIKIVVYAKYKITHVNKKTKVVSIKHTKEAIHTINVPYENKSEEENAHNYEEIAQNYFSDWKESRDELIQAGYSYDEDYYNNNVKLVEGCESKASAVSSMNVSNNKVPMKSACPMRRDWLAYSEGIIEKSFEDLKGQCVYELLCDHLKNYWITVSKEKLFEMFKEFVRIQIEDKDDECYLLGEPFNGVFDINSGVNTDMIYYLCNQKKISMYAFDDRSKCFKSLIFGGSNYRPICYYMLDCHMYLINQGDFIYTIGRSQNQLNNDTYLASSLIEEEKEVSFKDDILIFDEKCLESAINTGKQMQKNSIIFLNQKNMTKEIYDYIKKNKILPFKVKCNSGHEIIEISFRNKFNIEVPIEEEEERKKKRKSKKDDEEKKERKKCKKLVKNEDGTKIIKKVVRTIRIMCDQNLNDGLNWKKIKAVCEKSKIPFSNQSIGTLIYHIRKQFYRTDLNREMLSDDDKIKILDEQECECPICECQLQLEDVEYDHINPIVKGGSNDLNNIQALCKNCHFEKSQQERENSDYITSDPIISAFTDETKNIIYSKAFKQWAFVDKNYDCELKDFLKRNENLTVRMIDFNKMRRNIMINNVYKWAVYSVMDGPNKYLGDTIKPGNYFVNTKNYFPFRGSGWYPHPMIIQALEMNIITKEDIEFEYIASFSLKPDYFKEFVEHLLELTKDMELNDGGSLSKLIVNSFVGMFGNLISECIFATMTTDKYKASYELMDENKMVLGNKIGDTTLYTILETKKIKKEENCMPLYNHVISVEAMELYKLEQLIIKNGGQPFERNTDAIIYFGDEFELNEKWNSGELKHRYEEPSHLKRSSVCKMVREEKYILEIKPYTIMEEKDDYTELARDIIEENKSINILGGAGVGKSYLINEIIKILNEKEIPYKSMAPTNKASSIIGGRTIHREYLSVLHSNSSREKKMLNELKNYEYIIIDEISMVKEIFYQFFIMIQLFVPKMKFIIVGDFKQFLPVNDKFTGDYENSPALKQLCDNKQLKLTKYKRGKDIEGGEELFNLFQNPEKVEIKNHPFKKITSQNVAYTHETRKRVNKECM